MGDVDASVHIFTAKALERCKVAIYAQSSLSPEEPWYSLYRRQNGPQVQSGQEGVKKSPPIRQSESSQSPPDP